MKKLITLCGCLLTLASSAQNWIWAKNASGTLNDGVNAITNDNNGNLIATGWFQSPTITFGTVTLTNPTTNTAVPNNQFFLVKYDPSGNVLWAWSAGGASGEAGQAVATDMNGNIYVTGAFTSDTIKFGAFTLSKANFSEDVFTIKVAPNGTVLWAQGAYGGNQQIALGIAVDQQGDVVIVGHSGDNISFGTTTLTNTSNTSNMFVAKYNTNGVFQWARQTDGPGHDVARSVDVSSYGDVFVTGYYTGNTLTFGTHTITNTSATLPPISNSQGYDMFLVRYTVGGNEVWAKNIGGREDDLGISLSVSSSGNLYIGGYYSSPTVAVGNTTLTNVGSSGQMEDIFLLKYDQNGNALWAKTAGGNDRDYLAGVKAESSGGAVLSGFSKSSTLSFGSMTLAAPSTDYDVIVAQYDSNGLPLLVESGGGTLGDRASSVSTDNAGNLYVAGYFQSQVINFDAITLNNSSTNGFDSDAFVAKLGSIVSTGLTHAARAADIWQVYPNPSTGKFLIRAQGNVDQIKSIGVYSTSGELIYRNSNILNTDQLILNLEDKNPGIYFITVTGNESVYTTKIIKE